MPAENFVGKGGGGPATERQIEYAKVMQERYRISKPEDTMYLNFAFGNLQREGYSDEQIKKKLAPRAAEIVARQKAFKALDVSKLNKRQISEYIDAVKQDKRFAMGGKKSRWEKSIYY